MQITLYRHAEPQVSADKKISGAEFVSWVHKYNASDIKQFDWSEDKLSRIFSSNLLRSYQTAKIIGKEYSPTNNSNFVHIERLSDGCISCYEIEKWNSLYSYLISHRIEGSDEKSVGTLIIK